MHETTYIIQGRPTVLKNSKQIAMIPHKGARKCRACGKLPTRPILRMSDAAKKAKDAAVRQLWRMRPEGPPIMGPVSVRMLFFCPMKSDALVDLSNLYQLYEDALQEVQIIDDDSQIADHDGSRIIRMCGIEGENACPKRQVITRGPRKGQLKDDCGAVRDCPFARVEITIRGIEDGEGERQRMASTARAFDQSALRCDGLADRLDRVPGEHQAAVAGFNDQTGA